MAVMEKTFFAFVSLLERVKAKYPHIHGEVVSLHGNWKMNGNLDLQVTLAQDAPTEKLKRFDPDRYTIHIVYNLYQGGAWGASGWDVRDYEDFRGQVPLVSENDAFLKPRQTPYTRGFGEHWRERLLEKYGEAFEEVLITGYPNPESWDGKRLLANQDYTIDIAD